MAGGKAKSSEQFHNLMEKVREAGVLYHCYIREMIDYNDDSELQAALGEKSDEDVEYLGVGIFGETEAVDKLTKKFGLWK